MKKEKIQYLDNQAKTKKINNREAARRLLISVTIFISIISLILLFSNSLASVAVLIALPFIAIGLFVLWGLYVAAPSLTTSKRKKDNSGINPLATTSIVLLILGGLFLGWFIIQGGPHNGAGGEGEISARHILGNTNPYLDMQVGLALLVLGTIFGIINRAIGPR